MRYFLLIFLFFFLFACQQMAEKEKPEFSGNKITENKEINRFKGYVNNGNQKIMFLITKKKFISDNHEITYTYKSKEWTALIDGKKPIGTDGVGAYTVGMIIRKSGICSRYLDMYEYQFNDVR